MIYTAFKYHLSKQQPNIIHTAFKELCNNYRTHRTATTQLRNSHRRVRRESSNSIFKQHSHSILTSCTQRARSIEAAFRHHASSTQN
eukprot:8345430-Lingulodinium_polyedra.AAC.1